MFFRKSARRARSNVLLNSQPKRTFRLPKLRLKKKQLIPLVLGICLVSALVVLVQSFIIKDVLLTEEGFSCINKSAVNTLLQKQNKNLLFLNETAVKEAITQKFVCVKEVVVEKKFPRTLSITTRSRTAVLVVELFKEDYSHYTNFQSIYVKPATVLVASGSAQPQTATPSSSMLVPRLDFETKSSSISGQVVVDGEGVIFSNSSEGFDVPKTALYLANTKLGGKVDPDLVYKIQSLYERLKVLGVTIISSKLAGQKSFVMEVVYPEGISGTTKKDHLAFSVESDIARQLASLQLILQKAKMDAKSVSSVDLRFNKPVVVYSK